MLLKHFIFKQIIRSKKQAVVFVLCVALSLSSIFALDVFSSSVNRSLMKDARRMHAADIIVRSRFQFSQNITARILELEERSVLSSARIYEFYSMVKSADAPDSVLSKLKIVAPNYPFYGKVMLASGRPFAQVLTPGTAVVEQSLLDRLHLKVGARIRVGDLFLTIADRVVKEPDRPISFYSFGPRVFIAIKDMDALNLVKKGSRIQHRYLIKLSDQKDINTVFSDLQSRIAPNERIATYRTAASRIKRYFDNFVFFLGLISIFTLLLAGIGIQSTLGAFLRENEKSIAIMRTVGATSRFVIMHFLIIALLLGLAGGVIGLFGGYTVLKTLLALSIDLLPEKINPAVTFAAMIKGVLTGLVVVSVFTMLPLLRIKALKPSMIFRKERIRFKKDPAYFVSGAVIIMFILVMTLWILENTVIALYFVMGLVLLILITTLITGGVLCGLKKVSISNLAMRQALKGLFRPGNATRSIIVTLTASLAVLFSIFLIERNLDASYIQSYPPDAPNLFFIDIQPSQKIQFAETLGRQAEYYPIIRAGVVSINGKKIDRDRERKRKGDHLGRTFNLTYRNHLLKDEVMHKGKTMFRGDFEGVQVSLLDTVQEIRPIDIGDRITFRVQGVPLRATVTSIRTRNRESIRPFFYFVFQPDVLKDAPQTIFTALKVEKEKIAHFQNTIVNRFPNVSVIDVTETIRVVSKVLRKLSGIIRFFMSLSVAAGILIVISSLLATRFTRIREAVYYKILGAGAGFVLRVFTLENLLIGLISAAIALLLSQTGCLILSRTVLNIRYDPFWWAGAAMAGMAGGSVLLIGLVSSVSILKKRPIIFLREQADE
jgi:putative ABC transport system permease protein